MFGSGGQNEGFALKLLFPGGEPEAAGDLLRPGDLGELGLRPQVLGLLQEGVRVIQTADSRDAGVIFHQMGGGDLPPESSALQHQHRPARPAGVDGGGKPSGAAAHN